MLRSVERCFGLLMLALMVASAIGCESQPRMVELNLGIGRDARLKDRGVEVHLVGVSETALKEWNDNTPQLYWEPNNHLRENANARGLIHRIREFRPNGPLGPIRVLANEEIWKKWKKSGAMHMFIYTQGVAVEGMTGKSQVLKRVPIDSGSYSRRQYVTISIMPSQITVNPPPKPQN